MSGLDWLIIAIALLSALLAAAQGFFVELFSLGGAIGGFIVAAWQYKTVAAWLLPFVKSDWVANIAGFLTIFFSVLLLAGFAGRLARWTVKEAGLRWVDRTLGAAFGLARGGLIAVVIVVALASFSPGAEALRSSLLAPYLLVAGQGASWLAPAALRESFRQG